MKKQKRGQKVFISLLVILLLLLGGGGYYLHQNTYTATPAAKSLSREAEETKDYYHYASNQEQATGVIFYPGALVEPDSYSRWATQVAKAGYDVYVMKMPLNLAVLSENHADTLVKEFPEKEFILAGHSLGGVMASRYARNHQPNVKGMIFLASYPDKKGSLKDSELPVLSITASNDEVLNWSAYQDAKAYLPEDTTYLSIEGGNHAGFGEYGLQKGDGVATIAEETQQVEISREIITWLDGLE